MIYVGSFSKVFSQGLRLGYMALPGNLLTAARAILEREPVPAPVLGQRPLARFMEGGRYLRHLRQVRRVYARRYVLLMPALNTHLSRLATWRSHMAGMPVAVHLPEHVRDTGISHALQKAQLGVRALSAYEAQENTANGLLLGFCATPDHLIGDSVRQIADVLPTANAG